MNTLIFRVVSLGLTETEPPEPYIRAQFPVDPEEAAAAEYPNARITGFVHQLDASEAKLKVGDLVQVVQNPKINMSISRAKDWTNEEGETSPQWDASLFLAGADSVSFVALPKLVRA